MSNREVRTHLLLTKQPFYGISHTAFMPRRLVSMNMKFVTLDVVGGAKGQPLDVIPMVVADERDKLDPDLSTGHEVVPQNLSARTVV
jgi:hypothetical protein